MQTKQTIQNEAIQKMDGMCNYYMDMVGWPYGKTRLFMLAGAKLWCERTVGGKTVNRSFISLCLDLVHGDDDWVLPLLLHHTGKKTVIKPHLTCAHWNFDSWGFPLKLDWKTWWICTLVTCHAITHCSIVLIKCPFILREIRCVCSPRDSVMQRLCRWPQTSVVCFIIR